MDADTQRAVLAICDGLPEMRFAPGNTLVQEGPGSGRMFILKSGEVEVLRGETVVSSSHEPGAIFGEMSVLLHTGHGATVRAVDDVVAYHIEDARTFLQKHPEIMFHVAVILAQRLQDATAYLADFKQQFANRNDHFGLVDEVLEALVQRQKPSGPRGSQLKSDPRL
jgi:CRP-like cAMP-binding protein